MEIRPNQGGSTFWECTLQHHSGRLYFFSLCSEHNFCFQPNHHFLTNEWKNDWVLSWYYTSKVLVTLVGVKSQSKDEHCLWVKYFIYSLDTAKKSLGAPFCKLWSNVWCLIVHLHYWTLMLGTPRHRQLSKGVFHCVIWTELDCLVPEC